MVGILASISRPAETLDMTCLGGPYSVTRKLCNFAVESGSGVYRNRQGEGASPEGAAPGRGRTLTMGAAKKNTVGMIALKYLRQLRGGIYQPRGGTYQMHGVLMS